jgi:hypothetical protein
MSHHADGLDSTNSTDVSNSSQVESRHHVRVRLTIAISIENVSTSRSTGNNRVNSSSTGSD